MNAKRENRITEPVAVATVDVSDEAMWKLIAGGDLKGLTDSQKTDYYLQLCRSLGMNPATQPFEYITLNGKLRLYAKKDATDQLRQIRGVSIIGKPEILDDGEYITATVSVEDKTGRSDSDIGVVFAGANKGEMRANLRMKALTKAKRRATLSVCGLGMLDEAEVEDIPGIPPRVSQATLKRLAPVAVVQPKGEPQEPPNSETDMEEALPDTPPMKSEGQKIIEAFASFGVTQNDIETYLQRDFEAMTETDRDSLKPIYRALKSKETTWADILKAHAAMLEAQTNA